MTRPTMTGPTMAKALPSSFGAILMKLLRAATPVLLVLVNACGSTTNNRDAPDGSSAGGASSEGGSSSGGGSASAGGATTSEGGSMSEGGSTSEGGAPGIITGEPGPGAFDPGFETSDDFFTRMTEAMPGLTVSPHGVVQIYYSANLEPLLDEEEFEVPEGSVAIKVQDRDGDDKVDNIMVMVKKEAGFDPDTRDWLYEQYSPSGALQYSGTDTLQSFCSDCHNGYPKKGELAGTELEN